MKVCIATDHNGVEQKKEIIEFLNSKKIEVVDLALDNNPTDDYPLYAGRVCKYIEEDNAEAGILMCGTGIGMSIAANKYKGIRCAKVSNKSEAELARLHNNANVIALSYKEDIEELKELIYIFLTTKFSNEERHVRRISMIDSIEG